MAIRESGRIARLMAWLTGAAVLLAGASALERLTERYQIVFDGSWTPPSVKLAKSYACVTR
jgi:hypothetical protein